jgi:soluble lytic murein transglycosylase-like protein
MKIIKKYLFVIFFFLLTTYAYSQTPYEKALDYYYQNKLDYALSLLDKTVKHPDQSFLRSLIYIKKKELVPARRYFNKYKNTQKNLQNYLIYIDYELALLEDNLPKAKKLLAQLQRSARNQYLSYKAMLGLGWYYLYKKQFKAAKRITIQLLNAPRDRVLYPQLIKFEFELELQRRNQEGALKQYGILIKNFPAEDKDKKIWNRLLRSFQTKMVIPDCFSNVADHMQYLRSLYESQDYVRAEHQAKFITQSFSKQADMKTVDFTLGKLYFYQYRFGKAIPELKKVFYNDLPINEAKKARYFIARSYQKMNRKDVAHREYLKIIEEITQNPYEAIALYHICSYYRDKGPYQTYKKYYDMFIENFEYTLAKQQFDYENNWSLLKTKKSEKEIKEKLKELLAPRVYSRLTAFYKSKYKNIGRKTGKKQYFLQGINNYPLSFFSSQILRKAFSKENSRDLNAIRNNSSSIIKKYNNLYLLGLGKLAAEDSEFMRSTSVGNSYQYLYAQVTLLSKLNKPSQAMKVLQNSFNQFNLQYGDIPQPFVKRFYPLEFWPNIKRYAQKHRVDPFLALALIREESRFDDKAASRSGALGLMQIVGKTGADMAYGTGKLWTGPKMLLEVDQNIEFGVYYLSWLKRMFRGNLAYVLSGYNAGPGNTQQWVGMYKNPDSDVFIKRIKYPETREYVLKVRDSYIIYRLLYRPD